MKICTNRILPTSLVAAFCCWLSACTSDDQGETPDLTRFNDVTVGACEQYDQSPLYRPRQNTQIVYPESDWVRIIERASPGTEILFEDGTYILNQNALRVRSGLTLRSLNADPSRVLVKGMGYAIPAQGIMILGNDITIADIALSDFRDHGVTVNPRSGGEQGLQLYNLDIKNIGTQHIKVNPDGARDGLIACSSIGYSEGGAQGDYNGAIDMHATIDWAIRDNYIYNITGDGSGCDVDEDCGRYISSPAILVWNNAVGTDVIGNTIVDSFRNIAFGLGTPHSGGRILHNTINQTTSGGAGIELFGATDAVIEFNSVRLTGNHPGAIEYRHTENLVITNNWFSKRPWDREGNVNLQFTGNALSVSESPHLR